MWTLSGVGSPAVPSGPVQAHTSGLQEGPPRCRNLSWGEVHRLQAGRVLPSSCSQADIITRTIMAVENHRLKCPCQRGCL